MLARRSVLASLFAMAVGPAMATGRIAVPEDKYQITDEERMACEGDAMNFCSMTYPDEDALLGCMKTARPKLTSGCRTIFEAGLRRRHIPF